MNTTTTPNPVPPSPPTPTGSARGFWYIVAAMAAIQVILTLAAPSTHRSEVVIGWAVFDGLLLFALLVASLHPPTPEELEDQRWDGWSDWGDRL